MIQNLENLLRRIPFVRVVGDYLPGERILFLSAGALLLGTLGAFMGWVLLKLIAFVINAAYYGRLSFVHQSIPDTLGWLSIVIPIVGGLIIGIMARFGSRQIRGHGIPEAMEAILEHESRIPPRVAWLKPLASAVSIGTGGPFGAEGPIIVTGAALGSVLGQLLPVNPSERKILLAAGAAAGMTVIFGTPLAAVLMAVELLLFEWKPRSLIPTAIAATVAQFWRPFLIEPGLMFPMRATAELPPSGFLWCVVVGVLAGVLAIVLTGIVYWFEKQFQKLPIHWMWWPALAGFFVGVVGWMDPRALGVGYHNIRALLNSRLSWASALKLFVAKGFVWSLALSSGTAGGVLAPLVMVGAAAGQLVGAWIPVGSPALWALLAMAGVMGCAMRAPLTAALFGFEVTGNANALPGLLLVAMIAHLMGVLFLKRSIMTEKLARRGHDVRQELTQDPFETERAGDFVRAQAHPGSEDGLNGCVRDGIPSVSERTLLSTVVELLDAHQAEFVEVLPETGGEPIGMIHPSDLIRTYTRSRLAERIRRRSWLVSRKRTRREG